MKIRVITIFIVLLIFPSQGFAQIQRVGMGLRRATSEILRTKPNHEQKKQLSPDPLDLKKYAQFLEQSKTGIFRLMPDIGCTENINVIKADAECLKFIPESSYYSFREKEHTLEVLADIRLVNGFLISDGVLAQGIIVQLGDVDLEKVAPTSDGLGFLVGFAPNAQKDAAQKQYLDVVRGIKAGNYVYKKAVPMIENTTYALRIVAYKGNLFRTFRGYRLDLLEGDKRIDLTIAFRIIRKGSDGGITLLWKEIERKDAPRLIVPKKGKKS